MTKFADQLFDDLMQEHGASLADVRVPSAPTRRHAGRPVLLAAGAAGAAVAVAAGLLTAGGGTPAYAVTRNPDGTVSLAVYQQSGIAGANQALHKLGDDRVVVVPVRVGCPSIDSLPKPVGHLPWVLYAGKATGPTRVPITVKAQDVPAGDILVVGYQTSSSGKWRLTWSVSRLTRPPAPSCVSLPSSPGTGSSPTSGPTAGSVSLEGGLAPTKSPRG
jgi:hypothetical protein